MNTEELLTVLSCDGLTKDLFLGVFPRDALPPKPVKKKTFCFIINTDPSNKPGLHWLAIFVNGGKGEFFVLTEIVHYSII